MHCIIVRRGDYQQYDVLYRTFGSRVPVIWDRRRAPQRTQMDGGAAHHDRRRRDPPASWIALGFVVVERAELTRV